VVSFDRDLLLINTPAVNYFKFPAVLTTPRSSTLNNAASNLGGIEVFLQAQYGWNEPFVLEPSFRPIKGSKRGFIQILNAASDFRLSVTKTKSSSIIRKS